MSQFLFEGDFRRKPMQQLGGNSRSAEQRDAVLQKAQAERSRRERDRAVAAAILTLQAYMRGYLDRKTTSANWRKEFDSRRGLKNSNEDLVRQILLLNSFFRYEDDDIDRLLELGKQLLNNASAVTNFMSSDSMGVFYIKQVLEKCVVCLNHPGVAPAVLLRMIETYTDPKMYQGSSEVALSDKTVEIVMNIWIHLLENADLFFQYRKFLEAKLPPMDNEHSVNRIIDTNDYLLVYKRIMNLKSELRNRNIRLSAKKGYYDVKNAKVLIFSKFILSFSENVMPVDGNSGIPAFYIIPRIVSAISWDEWYRVLPDVHLELKGWQCVRQILYVTLAIIKRMTFSEVDIGSLMKIICLLLPSIDPKFAPAKITNGLARQLEEWDEEMEGEEEEMEIDSTYYRECRMLYENLKDVINEIGVAVWLCPFQVQNWKSMCPIISCLVRLEPKLASVDFRFLSVLCYKKEFMRPLCLYSMSATLLEDDELLAFCWFFRHLMSTLHDAEFYQGININKDELAKTITMIKQKFGNMVLKDFENFDSVASTTLKMLATILMMLHDRNTRMNIFSEDMFISSTLSKICPVETHNLQFQAVTCQHTPDLGPMEAKLLKILRDFPFALSFHDRVKAWNRLLNLDKETREPNPMHHREDIQVRRNYIYEDAFEKLSPENVHDIRKHIRISLVNVVGVMEAGIDGGGLLREFLTESTKAAVDPNRGLFRFDSQNRIYPNPVAKKLLENNFRKHFFVIGRLVGKALYEQTLLELPMAAFFIQNCIEGKVSSAVDFLATLDPELHNNLLALKTFPGDLNSLGLDFTLALDELGETRVVELKKNGKETPVDKWNVIEYIHLVSDYKINKEMEEECRSFRAGLMDVVPTLRMFSWRELQTLISGSDRPIDVDDWRAHTNYGSGFTDNCVTVELFWQVVRSFDERCLRMLLKFVTSCSRPPLLGFKDLVPKFGIQSAGKNDRLPTAATCMNLLKLPEFEDAEQMREKLVYAISAHAGFELS